MADLFPHVIMPDDIRAVQARLRAAAAGIQATVDGCPQLDPNTKMAWDVFKTSVDDYTSAWVVIFYNVTASFYETGLDLERDLEGWQTKLENSGCAAKAPHFQAQDPNTGGGPLPWVSAAVVAVAGAYAVSRVVPIIATGIGFAHTSIGPKGVRKHKFELGGKKAEKKA